MTITAGELIDKLYELCMDYPYITRDTPIRMTTSSFNENIIIRSVEIDDVRIVDYDKEYRCIILEGEQP